MNTTINQRIAFMIDEIKRKKRLLPHLIEEGKVTDDESVYILNTMTEILETLTQIKGIANE